MFRIKICGITRVQDAVSAAAAGADAIGLNFYPESRRFIAPPDAEAIVAKLPAGITKVGVFVNATVHHILAVAERLGLDAIQLHGDEPPDRLVDLREYRVIRAFRCGPGAADCIRTYVDACHQLGCPPDAVLVDAHVRGRYGGTGQVADWGEVRRIGAALGAAHLILAGGLHPENVREAIERARPSAVDVAGGVESHPGCKDRARMERFIQAARAALVSFAE